MSIRVKIYQFLVNRVPGIRERYHRKREHSRGARRVLVWLYLLWLNFAYSVLRIRRIGRSKQYPVYEKKRLYSGGSESSLSKRETPQEFAEKLAAYDVISFDVFDTLILRPFARPTDLFYVLGDQFAYPDFRNIRIRAEEQARREKRREAGHAEVTVDEIYAVLAQETGLPADPEPEVSAEERLCYAHPYMLEVVRLLHAQGKRLILTSDMYLQKERIERIVKRAGYPAFAACYVSCAYGQSKSTGDLYDTVRTLESGAAVKRFAHVGDSRASDVEHAKKHGFAPFSIRNVNEAGDACRPQDMSVITGSVYRGLVNGHIHNGLQVYTPEYEYGYIYGGLFVTGYCRFIHAYVQAHAIDKILFLSRDGYVLQKVYQELYPEETNTEYVYWSRLAGMKLTADHFRSDYFRRFLQHKENQGIPLREIFASMEIPGLLEVFCREREQAGDGGRWAPETMLTDKNAGEVKRFLMTHWQDVTDTYAEQIEAAGAYYRTVLDGVHSAAAVDIGWAGSGAIALHYMVNTVWGMDCPVTGIIAGTNTAGNTDPDATETFLQSGKLVSYLYSQRANRDIWKFHDPGRNHNLYLEMLLDAPGGSLQGFYRREDGSYEPRFKPDTKDARRAEEIQRGILAFSRQWKTLSQKDGLLDAISGRDAYAPLLMMENSKNKRYLKHIDSLMDEAGI